jgi:hypothetical protein
MGWKGFCVSGLSKATDFLKFWLQLYTQNYCATRVGPPGSMKVYDHRGGDHAAGDQSLNRFLCTELCQSSLQDGDYEHSEK